MLKINTNLRFHFLWPCRLPQRPASFLTTSLTTIWTCPTSIRLSSLALSNGQRIHNWLGLVVWILIGAAVTTVIVSVPWFRVTLLQPVVICWCCTGNDFVPATDKLVGSDLAIGSWIPVNLKASRTTVIVLIYVRHLPTKPEIDKINTLANPSLGFKIVSFSIFCLPCVCIVWSQRSANFA